jgi:hypothetical protein
MGVDVCLWEVAKSYVGFDGNELSFTKTASDVYLEMLT